MPVSLARLSIVATALPLLVLSVGMVVLALVALPLPTARRRYVLQSLDRDHLCWAPDKPYRPRDGVPLEAVATRDGRDGAPWEWVTAFRSSQ